MHTYIYISIYIHIGLASSNVSRRIRLEPVQTHTHNLFLFQSDLGVWMSRERHWTIEMRKHHWCERNFFFMQCVIVAASILSRNDSRLIKLAQCVNLIHRFPSYSISFYTHTHTFYPLCFDKFVCVLYH